MVRRHVGKMTGLSPTQVTRPAGQYVEHGDVKEAAYQRRRFASRYTRDDRIAGSSFSPLKSSL